MLSTSYKALVYVITHAYVHFNQSVIYKKLTLDHAGLELLNQYIISGVMTLERLMAQDGEIIDLWL